MTTKNNSQMKAARKRLKYSQADLAEMTGLSQQLISQIESGIAPSVEAALFVADRLHCTVDELFGDKVFAPRAEITVAFTIARMLDKSIEELYGDIFLDYSTSKTSKLNGSEDVYERKAT